MLQDTDLRGVVCAAVTPVDSRGEVDIVELNAHCTQVLNEGCSFVSVFGTTGEGASFSAAERVSALETLAQNGADMSRHIPAIIASSVDDAALLYRTIHRLGCRAALIIPPFYYTATDEGVVDFYRQLVARAGNPACDIVLYNFPHFSGVSFTPELVAKVQQGVDGRVIGLKDSTGDLEGGRALISAFPELSIFTGDDRLITRMVAAGGAGIIGGMVNMFAQECSKLYLGAHDENLEMQAKIRIEAVDQNGGLVVLKSLIAKLKQTPSFARFPAPLRAASDDVLANAAAEFTRADALEKN